MRVFVDTEFTDFLNCELISIALVAEDGSEFYAESTDFDRTLCSPFVWDAVLPQLGRYPERQLSRSDLRAALLTWLAQIGEGLFCVDFHGDWDLLVDILDGVPNGWEAMLLSNEIDNARLEDYFYKFGGRHHALHDARALRYAVLD
ncbi:3'-5' exoribonuclease [Robbsia andropogonis]|uniref:3'-5' exoribonuclease n=1 Tax=Robbsia andropogonis TaxID=28092 RepID=UPI000466E101|nr:3'-5' exoribonuclease [Robbsia andropogonis]